MYPKILYRILRIDKIIRLLPYEINEIRESEELGLVNIRCTGILNSSCFQCYFALPVSISNLNINFYHESVIVNNLYEAWYTFNEEIALALFKEITDYWESNLDSK